MKNRGLEMKEEQKGKNWSTKLVANIIISSSELHNIIIFFGSLFFSTFRHISYHHFEIFFLFFFTCRQIHQLYTKEISFFLSFGGTGGVATFFPRGIDQYSRCGNSFSFSGKASSYNVLFIIVFVFLYPTFVSLVCFLDVIQSRKSWWAVVKSGTF